MVRIRFNGEERDVPDGTSIEELLKQSGVNSRFCAVEVNLEIVPREDFSDQIIKSDDAIEVVTLVGGG